jgi:hypothetical protein
VDRKKFVRRQRYELVEKSWDISLHLDCKLIPTYLVSMVFQSVGPMAPCCNIQTLLLELLIHTLNYEFNPLLLAASVRA